MANPIKAVKAAKRLIVGSNKDFKTNKGINKKLDKILNTSVISQGKAKAIKRNVRVKEFVSPIAKGSNKKVGASAKANRGFIKSKVKEMVREEKKAGYAMNPKYFNSEIRDKGRNSGQFSSANKKIPVKRRGK